MSQSPKRSRYTVAAIFVAGLTGFAYLLRRLFISQPSGAPLPVVLPDIPQPVLIPEVRVLPQPSIWVILTSALGGLCLIIAQALLLNSRHPVLPLILLIVGYILLQSMLAYYEKRWFTETVDKPVGARWMFTDWIGILKQHAREMLVVGLFMLAAIAMQLLTPVPSGMRSVQSLIFSALLIPAVYWLGYWYGDVQIGLIAAGFSAVAGWTLALGHTDPVYITLALLYTLYVIALEYFWGRQDVISIIFLLGIGLLISPNFIYPILLLPIGETLLGLDKRRPWWQIILRALFVFIIAGILIIPRLIIMPSVAVLPLAEDNPQFTFSEGLFTSLLMFNLTTDPDPLHGIVNRPVFSPIMAAAFVIGLLGTAWRINARRLWSDSFLIWALLIGLLPSALLLDPPVRYPDLKQASMALPVAVFIAAYGLSLFTRMLVQRLGKMGVIIACVLILVMLAFVAGDAYLHHVHVFAS